jgi:hypothetical protein
MDLLPANGLSMARSPVGAVGTSGSWSVTGVTQVTGRLRRNAYVAEHRLDALAEDRQRIRDGDAA